MTTILVFSFLFLVFRSLTDSQDLRNERAKLERTQINTLSSNSTVHIYELLCDIVPFVYTFYILLGEICLF